METLTFLMTSTFYPPYHLGGDATHVKYLASELVKRGHEVHVMHSLDAYNLKRSGPDNPEFPDDGVNVHTLKSPYGRLSTLKSYAGGSSDYVNKDNLGTLAGTVRRALAEFNFREEKLQMERALAEREAKYRKLFEDSGEGILVTDLTGVIVDCNLTFEQFLGYSREEMLGERIFEFFRDEEKRNQINQQLQEKGVVENFELEFYRQDGRLVYGLVTISYLNDDSGEPDALLGLVRDVTERVKNQRETEKIVAINAAMRSATDNETLYPIVMDLLMDVSGAQGVALQLVNQINGRLMLEVMSGVWETLVPADIILKEKGLAKLLGSGEPVFLAGGKAGKYLSKEATQGLGSIVILPLTSGEIDIGLVWMGCNDDCVKENLDLVQVLAQITANTIHRFNLNENNLRALQESRALARISRTLNEQLDLEKVFSLIVEEAVRIVVGAHRAVIHLFDEDNQRLHAVAFSAKNGAQITQRNLLNIRVSPKNEFDFGLLSEKDIQSASMISGRGIAGLVIKERQTINVIDARKDQRYLKTGDEVTTLSLVVSPIISGDLPLGTLSVLSREVGAFDASVELLLENLCVQAATAIENARLLEAERQAREIAEAQSEISMLLNQSLELEEVLDMILRYAIRVFNATAANIMLFEGGKLQVYHHKGYEFLGDEEEEYTQMLVEFVQKNIDVGDERFGKSFVIPDTQEDEDWTPDPRQHWVRSFASVPLLMGEQVIGVLNVDSERPNTFGEREVQFFQVFANNAASAVNNARLYEDL